MTLEELKSLRQGEKVIFIKADEKIREYHNHQVGDEMMFVCIEEETQVANFMRDFITLSHFSYEICHYIERKVVLERETKLKDLGI